MQCCQLAGKLDQPLGDSGQAACARCGAGRKADVGRLGLGPGAGERPEAEAAVGRDPRLAVAGIVDSIGNPGQHGSDDARRQGHPAGTAASSQDASEVRQGARASACTSRNGLPSAPPAGGRRERPGVQQAGALQRRLDASALVVADRRSEIDQLPQRGADAGGADLRITGMGADGPASTPFSRRLRSSSSTARSLSSSRRRTSSATRRWADRTLCSCWAVCRRRRAGLSPSSTRTHSANAVTAACRLSALVASLLEIR